MKLPILGGQYEYRSPNVNAQECENLFIFIDQEGGEPVSLINTPGCKVFSTLGAAAEVRGLHEFGENLIAVCGNTVYKVNQSGTATSLGTIGTSQGQVSMADNGTQLILVDGSSTGYLYSAGVFAAISDDDFPGADVVVFQDGYFIINQPSTDYFWISSLYDGDEWNALDVGTAEYRPDEIFSAIVDHGELINFGTKTVEPFRNSGDPDFPFERILSGVMEMGCGAMFSPANNDNSVFWLNNRNQVVRANGYVPVIISTRQIEYQISQYSKVSDAIGFTFVLEGHSFYALTFPTADVTWLYNASTTLWSKWSSYPKYKRHRANCYAHFDRKHIVGDYENGKLYELDMNTYTDNGQPIKRVRAIGPIRNKNNTKIVYPSIELSFEGGVGLATGQGSDPKVMLDWSDDGGHTWSNEHWADIGKIGDRKNKAIWKRLGRSDERVIRWTITDPVPIVITGADAPNAYAERRN